MLHAHGTHRKGTNPLRAASEFDHPSAWPFGLVCGCGCGRATKLNHESEPKKAL